MNEIIEQIQKSKKVLLHCHPNPDPDSVGSTSAMRLALEKIGKEVIHIKGDSNIPKSFKFPQIEKIVEKNISEIDLKNFDTFLILDSGSIDMVSAKYPVVFPETLTTIVIDHHASNVGYGKFNLIDPRYSSTAQLVYDILIKMNIEIDHDIALNLFMGIYSDTGGFRYGDNGAEAIEIASRLAMIAPDYQKTISIMENSNTKESLIFEGLLMNSVKTYFDGKLAIAYISNEDLVKNNIEDDDMFTGHITNKLKSVIGVEISAALIEREPNLVKISFRSRDSERYDVSKLATILGGGGHKAAAGVKIKLNIKDALDKVVNTVKELYNI